MREEGTSSSFGKTRWMIKYNIGILSLTNKAFLVLRRSSKLIKIVSNFCGLVPPSSLFFVVRSAPIANRLDLWIGIAWQ